MTAGRPQTTRCGTPSGYNRHQNADEKPCDACAAAKAAYDQRWRAAPGLTRRNRLHAKAQAMANARLRRAHPDEYRAYYAEAKAEVFATEGESA